MRKIFEVIGILATIIIFGGTLLFGNRILSGLTTQPLLPAYIQQPDGAVYPTAVYQQPPAVEPVPPAQSDVQPTATPTTPPTASPQPMEYEPGPTSLPEQPAQYTQPIITDDGYPVYEGPLTLDQVNQCKQIASDGQFDELPGYQKPLCEPYLQ